MKIDKALEIVHGLQKKYPQLHVGGSVGLFLHGIDLGRQEYNDLDFCINEDLFSSEMEHANNSGNDFDYKKTISGIDYEIRVDAMQSFVVKKFNGKDYNVSELYTIVYYKKLYQNKGYLKHAADLAIIYKHIGDPVLVNDFDDLPF